MFRTAGYYRGVNCPFFASGLCERPYCHFRHVKQDHNEDLNNKPQTPSSSKDASSYLEKLSDGQFPLTSESIRSFSKDSEVIPDEKKSGKQAFNKYTGEPINDDEAELDISAGASEVNKYTGKPIEYNKYTGEPIYHTEDSSSLNKRWTDSVLVSSSSSTPTYNPTPLSELQKRNANPNVSKYSLSASTSTSSQEYDPESNYSTSTKINHVPVPQVGRPSYTAKRSCSYDPSNATYKKPVLKRQRVASFFDAKFSSDEEDEEISKSKNKKESGKDEKSVSSDKEDKFHLKDVNYFEKLLDGPKDAKNSRVKVESDDSLDSLDEDVDVTPLIEKCRRRSQSGGTDQDSAEEKTEEKTCTKDSSKDEDSSHISTEIVSNKVKEKSDSKDKKTKEKSSNENKKSTEICDKSYKKNSASSSHSKSSHHRTSKSSKENSSKYSQDNGNSIHKSIKESSSKSSHQGTSNSSHKSSKESSAKSSHRKTEHNGEKNSHHPSSPKCQSSSVSKAEKVITKRKSRDSQDSKSSENENHVCDKSKDSSKSSNHHHKHSKHSNSELSSSSHKHQSNYEKGLKKNSTHNSSHSSGSSKGSKDKQNKAKQKDSKGDNHKGTKSKSVSSDRRKSAECTKKKIVDINVDLFGADSEEEDDDDEDLVEVPMATIDVNHSEQDMVMFLNDSDYSDEDIDRYDECLRIFQENKGMVNSNDANKKKSSPEKSHDEKVPSAPTGKQRMAHKKDSEMNRKMKVVEKPKVKMSPAEVMHNRFLQIQKKAQEAAAAAKATSSGNNETASSSTTKNPLSGAKKRTAHTPSTSKSNGKPTEKTVITTASRTEKRKARTPNISNLVRPTIPSEFGSKVPYNVRQRYLNLIIDECLKICDSEQEAFDKGQVEEAAVYKRASSKTVYLNVAVNTIKRLRSEQAGPSTAKKPKQTVFQLSHEQILGGKNATKTTFTVNRSGGGSKLQEENFKGAELYKRLTRYILTEEQMKENGFPRPSPSVSGSAVFFVEPRKKINVQSSKPTNYEKLCVRCGKMFTVYPNGTYATKEECSFHWGKAWKKRVAGMIDTRYTCCQGDLSSDGCQISKGHVHETNKWEALSGYMKTFPCSPPCDGDYGVFALDCEMVYTKFGIELARVTVTDPENDCVYETLVKPDAAVVDYNTRFSGLTEEHLKDVTTTLRDVQAVLLSLFSDRTIVMGHSLESDFSAVKLLHNTVVDTSVVFPHKMGPPYKRALKTLMAEYLKKIIQDDVGGHDSKEDSTSCMELMHLKIKEDARKEPRRS